MKKFYILALGLLLGAANVFAQDEDNEIDDTFQFCYKDGTVVPNGTVLNVYNYVDDEVSGKLYVPTGLYVKNTLETGAYTSMQYTQKLDNGAVQLCYPGLCKDIQGATGETEVGAMLAGAFQNLQSEWKPTAPGKATVTYHIKRYEKVTTGKFTYNYEFLADGPTVTVNFYYDPAGINNVNSGNVARTVYYDMAGRLVREPGKGLYVKKSTLADGTVKTQKVVLK